MKRYRVKPGARIDLGRWDPAEAQAHFAPAGINWYHPA